MDKEENNKDNIDKKDDNIISCVLATETANSTNNVGIYIQYSITEIFFIIIFLYWIDKHKSNYDADLYWDFRVKYKKTTVYYVSISYTPKINHESYFLVLPMTEEEFIFFLGLAFALNQIIQEPIEIEEVVEP